MATGKGINLALANMKCFGRPGKEYVFRVGWWITIRAFVPPYELRMHYFGEEFGEKSIITEIDNYVEINFGLFICEVVLLDDEQWQPMKWIPFFHIFQLWLSFRFQFIHWMKLNCIFVVVDDTFCFYYLSWQSVKIVCCHNDGGAFSTLYNFFVPHFFSQNVILVWHLFLYLWFYSVCSKVPAFGNDFKKPIWYDEESDDELFDNNKMFGFQVFSNPMEIQKYHEQQMQRMLKAFEQFEGGLNASHYLFALYLSLRYLFYICILSRRIDFLLFLLYGNLIICLM